MAECSPRRVENTGEKGEIACYKQFLHFPQCFQKACFPEASKCVIAWEWVKCCHHLKNLKSNNFKEKESHDGPGVIHLSLVDYVV